MTAAPPRRRRLTRAEQRALDHRVAALEAAARALVARATERSPAFGGRPHEAVGEREYNALAALVRS